jgi:hypothetical protein
LPTRLGFETVREYVAGLTPEERKSYRERRALIRQQSHDKRLGLCTLCHEKPNADGGQSWSRIDQCLDCDRKTRTQQLKGLREMIGIGAVMSLQRGGVLHCWRRSSPHNWWVAPKRDMHAHIWHSERGERPNLSMFVVVSTSKEKVSYGPQVPGGFRGSDEGSPEHSQYRLRKVFC